MANLNSDLTPTTELEAINEILASIGESPVQSLADVGLGDAALASTKLREHSRDVQMRGWSFNTELEVPMSRSVDGFLLVPSNALQATISRTEGRRGVQRGVKLYDLDKHTFVWDRDLKMDFVLFLGYEELPQHARKLVYVRAARAFARSTMLTQTIEQVTEDDEKAALREFKRAENAIARRNIFRDSATGVALVNRLPLAYQPY